MSEQQASSRFLWPPTIFAAALLAAGGASWLLPLPFLPAAPALALRLAGGALGLLAIGLAVAAEHSFRRAGTPVRPTQPSRALVGDGVYRWTRNPMYLAMLALLAGLGIASDSLWFLIAVPPAALALTGLAIRREERYLEAKFGEAYRDYCRRVRRWL